MEICLQALQLVVGLIKSGGELVMFQLLGQGITLTIIRVPFRLPDGVSFLLEMLSPTIFPPYSNIKS